MSDTEQREDSTPDEENPAAAPQTRGLIDGSLNNAHVLDHSNVLGAMVQSKLDDESNNVANARNAGNRNNTVND